MANTGNGAKGASLVIHGLLGFDSFPARETRPSSEEDLANLCFPPKTELISWGLALPQGLTSPGDEFQNLGVQIDAIGGV